MVNIYDIQLGNLFLYQDTVFRADSYLSMKDFGSFAGYLKAYASELDPLPPSKDLFRKLGFVKSGDAFYHSEINSICIKYYRVDGWVLGKYDKDIAIFTAIHELQNLFYALTKTKLVICK
jgi:hypothetical protein